VGQADGRAGSGACACTYSGEHLRAGDEVGRAGGSRRLLPSSATLFRLPQRPARGPSKPFALGPTLRFACDRPFPRPRRSRPRPRRAGPMRRGRSPWRRWWRRCASRLRNRISSCLCAGANSPHSRASSGTLPLLSSALPFLARTAASLGGSCLQAPPKCTPGNGGRSFFLSFLFVAGWLCA
jgi:hypothetical protein